MRILILGVGDVGSYLASTFSADGHEVIAIDANADALASAEEHSDIMTLQGDCTHRSTLETAGAERAGLVIAVTGSDQVNIVGAAMAAAAGAQRTIARVDDPKFYRSAQGVESGVLGIHSLLCASRLISEELLRQVQNTQCDFVNNFCGNSLQLTGITLPPTSPQLGKTPAELKLLQPCRLVAVMRDGVMRDPIGIQRFESDDMIVLSGPPHRLAATSSQILEGKESNKTVIVGGGDVGLQLARALLQLSHRVQIIETNRERCEFLAEELPSADVIHGDGTSVSILKDERIDRSDYLLTATRRDEINLMVSLMARDLGVRNAFALVHRHGYTETYVHLGLSGAAGAHDVIARAIRGLVPSEKALLDDAVPGSSYRILEFQLGSKLQEKIRTEDLNLPDGVLICGAGRSADYIPPDERNHLYAGDRIVLICPQALEKAVQRKMSRFGGGELT